MPPKLVSILLGRDAGPDGARVEDGTRSWTRRELRRTVAGQVARLRASGLRGGDRVLALVDHDAYGVAFLAAASALGLRVLMPYNLGAAALAEWRTIVDSARPDRVVHAKEDPGPLADLGQLPAPVVDLRSATGDDPYDEEPGEGPGLPRWVRHRDPVPGFLTLFTSGTTGAPKAISIPESLVCRRLAAVSARLAFTADARVLLTGLLNNTTGVIFAFGALLHGATLLIPRQRDPATWPSEVAERRATHLMLRPVAMKHFLEAATAGAADLSSLRVLAYGAAPMPRAVLEDGRALLPCDWVQGYGLSETYGPFCWLDEAAHRDRLYRQYSYCVGRPDGTAEVRVLPVDGHSGGVGEVAVRGGLVMEGYLDVATGALRPPGEWLRTGDLGCWSPTGELVLKGRISNTVLSRNGHRIYPEEIESVLGGIPGVDDVVLVGVTGDGPEERPVACLSGPLAAGTPAQILGTVTDTLGRAVSPEKWPDQLFVSTAPFPRSGNDKVLRARVAELAGAAELIDL